MPRNRQISDAHIYDLTRRLLASGGARAVTFAAVAKQSGLSGPSLVQRYQSREAMLRAALIAGWDNLDAATDAAIASAGASPKGLTALLKTLAPDDLALPASELKVLTADLSDPVLRLRALGWRSRMIAAIAVRLKGKDPDGAEMIFAAWQGRLLWSAAGTDGFRLRDLQKRLNKSES